MGRKAKKGRPTAGVLCVVADSLDECERLFAERLALVGHPREWAQRPEGQEQLEGRPRAVREMLLVAGLIDRQEADPSNGPAHANETSDFNRLVRDELAVMTSGAGVLVWDDAAERTRPDTRERAGHTTSPERARKLVDEVRRKLAKARSASKDAPPVQPEPPLDRPD